MYTTDVKIIPLLHCACVVVLRDIHVYVVCIQAASDRKSFSNIVYCSVGPILMNAINSVDKYDYFNLRLYIIKTQTI